MQSTDGKNTDFITEMSQDFKLPVNKELYTI